MGETGVATSTGGAAVFWNPANNVFVDFENSLVLQHHRYLGLFNHESAAVANRMGKCVLGVIFMGFYSDSIERYGAERCPCATETALVRRLANPPPDLYADAIMAVKAGETDKGLDGGAGRVLATQGPVVQWPVAIALQRVVVLFQLRETLAQHDHVGLVGQTDEIGQSVDDIGGYTLKEVGVVCFFHYILKGQYSDYRQSGYGPGYRKFMF